MKSPKTPPSTSKHSPPATTAQQPFAVFPELCSPSPVRLTVWCKSLLFNGHGYTVFDDADGRMVFRVDNYAHNWREEMVLMDSAGNALLTVRRCRKILRLMESWEIYKGDIQVANMAGLQVPIFRATKDMGNSSCSVSIVPRVGGEASGYWMSWSPDKDWWSKIYRRPAADDESTVAEVSRKLGASKKALLDKDVFTLTVQPGMDQAIAMAMIMITNSMR
ncbi:protein LURP-one-related 8-like [Typha latifolia]|uniref:protein LURP-one-related 8-like n=1 Tax=Typha latifolia TaxID=4733 RepID=UPI003C2E441C